MFWVVIVGFVIIFFIIYIFVINYDVFKYVLIIWEWGIVFVEVMLFFVGCEMWKWVKRIFF